jgi:hypothetical protein
MERTRGRYCYLRLYAFYLKIINFCGVFPFQLTYNSKTQVLESVDYHKSGVWKWLNHSVMVEYFALSVLTVFNFAASIVSVNPKISSANNILTVCFFALNAFAMISGVFHFNFQKRRVCDILNELLRIQRELIASKLLLWLYIYNHFLLRRKIIFPMQF